VELCLPVGASLWLNAASVAANGDPSVVQASIGGGVARVTGLAPGTAVLLVVIAVTAKRVITAQQPRFATKGPTL